MNRSKHKFSLKNLTKEQKKLRKRILEISHESHFSHLGSCLSAVDLIDAIYKIKSPDEKFILSNGHAGIAWYAVLEKNGFFNAPDEIKKLNIHPDRNPKYDIYASSGSLGQGLPIAIGIALSNRTKKVYCMLSDGECAEGSIWEALRVIYEQNLYNIKITINANGWSAYDKVQLTYLAKRMQAFGFIVQKINGHDTKNIIETMKKKIDKPQIFFAYTSVEQFPFLNGLEAHYYIMEQKDFELAMEELQ